MQRLIEVENPSEFGWAELSTKSKGKLAGLDKELQIVIGGGASKFMYLTSAMMDILGKPDFVKIYVKGSMVGVTGSEDGRKIVRSKRARFPLVILPQEIKDKVFPGVYDIHFENGLVVFDLTQRIGGKK